MHPTLPFRPRRVLAGLLRDWILAKRRVGVLQRLAIAGAPLSIELPYDRRGKTRLDNDLGVGSASFEEAKGAGMLFPLDATAARLGGRSVANALSSNRCGPKALEMRVNVSFAKAMNAVDSHNGVKRDAFEPPHAGDTHVEQARDLRPGEKRMSRRSVGALRVRSGFHGQRRSAPPLR